MSEAHHPSEAALAEELKLRARPPSVARLSRRVLVGVGAVSALAVAAALGWALLVKPHRLPEPTPVAIGTPPPERLAMLPKDYLGAGVPKLGPPLPGDLGKPFLEAQRQARAEQGDPADGGSPSPPPDPVRAQAQQGITAARGSPLFTSQGASPLPNPGAGSALASPVTRPSDGDPRIVSPERLQDLVSPNVVQAGSVLPAALMTGIRSDLPGQVIAQVTENVHDTPTGRVLLIPQGSRLIGTYDAQPVFGQQRVLLVWSRLILPDGRSLVLDKAGSSDPQGYAGLQDGVDRHWGALVGAATLSTVLAISAELGSGQDDSAIVRALREGSGQAFNQVGQQAVGKALNLAPTLTIRSGAPVRVLVTRDLVLEPYGQRG